MGRDNAHGGSAVGWARTGGGEMSGARTWAAVRKWAGHARADGEMSRARTWAAYKKTAQGLETLRGGVENDGGSRRNRTTDTRIFSPLLYLLS